MAPLNVKFRNYENYRRETIPVGATEAKLKLCNIKNDSYQIIDIL
jgi:hypothetical protein